MNAYYIQIQRKQKTHHLPHLHDVILRNRTDNPRLILVPREVRDFGGVASVDELENKITHLRSLFM